MELTAASVCGHRLRAHHLYPRLPAGRLAEAAGACGIQNSPPGAWLTAMYNRMAHCTRAELEQALERDKILLQAWSIRGAPLVFPTAQAGVFLTPLQALPGEEPWIYTRGVSLALEQLSLSFDQALALVREAAGCLAGRTVTGKDALDALLAAEAAPRLDAARRAVWDGPSPYGVPGRQTGQTLGGAVASFLLRPCAFGGQVVFGARAGQSPAFTSPQSWLGASLDAPADGASLARRFVHCQGPAAPADFAAWLGASPSQARRLWNLIAGELMPVTVAGRACWALAADADSLAAGGGQDCVTLAGPHDPYLDVHGPARAWIEPDEGRRRMLWRTVANPGAVLAGGQAVGMWQVKTRAGGVEVTVTLWRPLPPAQRAAVQQAAEAWAAFQEKPLYRLTVRT